jgi:hypothetical protein
VGLGHWPSTVHGLLANANDKIDEIAARDGEVLSRPFPFKEGPLLDACMIDVAMLGGRAAKVFAGRSTPVVVGNAQ